MGKSCCEAKSIEIAKLRDRQAGVLKVVLFLNAFMFVVEIVAGYLSKSTALKADALDMFGDASVYAFSLYALHKGALWRARAGLTKGIIMLVFGLLVLAQAVQRFMDQTQPVAETMGIIGLMALAANLYCLVLLYRHRADDVNMRSTWLCSRNDIIANSGVIGAGVLVAVFGSGLPDLIVGVAIASLFIWSSWEVITEAKSEVLDSRLIPDPSKSGSAS